MLIRDVLKKKILEWYGHVCRREECRHQESIQDEGGGKQRVCATETAMK